MSFYDSLPAVNAALNATAAVLLCVAYVLIRRRHIEAHRRVMITAFCVSVVFLASYLLHHYHAGIIRYQGTGLARTAYLWLLGTHTVLAAITPVLAILTLKRGLAGSYSKHRAIARWTLPIWLYVSVTGVAVYFVLYR